MSKPWHDPEWKSLPENDRQQIFNMTLGADPEYRALPVSDKQIIRQRIIGDIPERSESLLTKADRALGVSKPFNQPSGIKDVAAAAARNPMVGPHVDIARVPLVAAAEAVARVPELAGVIAGAVQESPAYPPNVARRLLAPPPPRTEYRPSQATIRPDTSPPVVMGRVAEAVRAAVPGEPTTAVGRAVEPIARGVGRGATDIAAIAALAEAGIPPAVSMGALGAAESQVAGDSPVSGAMQGALTGQILHQLGPLTQSAVKQAAVGGGVAALGGGGPEEIAESAVEFAVFHKLGAIKQAFVRVGMQKKQAEAAARRVFEKPVEERPGAFRDEVRNVTAGVGISEPDMSTLKFSGLPEMRERVEAAKKAEAESKADADMMAALRAEMGLESLAAERVGESPIAADMAAARSEAGAIARARAETRAREAARREEIRRAQAEQEPKRSMVVVEEPSAERVSFRAPGEVEAESRARELTTREADEAAAMARLREELRIPELTPEGGDEYAARVPLDQGRAAGAREVEGRGAADRGGDLQQAAPGEPARAEAIREAAPAEPEAGTVERRSNLDLRAAVERSGLTAEQIHDRLFLDRRSGIRSRAALDLMLEQGALEGQRATYFDGKGIKKVNDTYGHDAGDMIVDEIARVVRAVYGDERAYRANPSGDEFLGFEPDPVRARELADEVVRRLADAEVTLRTPDGLVVIKGIEVRYGIGETIAAADRAANAAREAERVPAAAGRTPAGVPAKGAGAGTGRRGEAAQAGGGELAGLKSRERQRGAISTGLIEDVGKAVFKTIPQGGVIPEDVLRKSEAGRQFNDDMLTAWAKRNINAGTWSEEVVQAWRALGREDRMRITRDGLVWNHEDGLAMPNEKIAAFFKAWEAASTQIADRAEALGVQVRGRDGKLRDFARIDRYIPHELERSVVDQIRNQDGEKYKALVKWIEKNWPIKPGQTRTDWISEGGPNTALWELVQMRYPEKRMGSLEFTREAKLPRTLTDASGKEFNVLRDDPEMLLEHINDAAQRLAVIEVFGQRGAEKKLLGIENRLVRDGIPQTQARNIIVAAWERLTGELPEGSLAEHHPRLEKGLQTLESVTAATQLSLSAVPNFLGGFTNEAVRMGLKSTAEAAAKAYGTSLYGADALEVRRLGNITRDIAEAYHAMEGLTGRARDVAKGTMTATGMKVANDKINLGVAYNAVAQLKVMADMLQSGERGIFKRLWGRDESAALRYLTREWGFSEKDIARMREGGSEALTDVDKARAIQSEIEWVNAFNEAPTRRPPFWNNRFMRLVFAYNTYARKTARTTEYAVREAAHGNVRPILTMLVAGTVSGELIQAVRNWLKDRRREDETLFERLVNDQFEVATFGLWGNLQYAARRYQGDPRQFLSDTIMPPAGDTIVNFAKFVRDAGGKLRPAYRAIADGKPLGSVVEAAEQVGKAAVKAASRQASLADVAAKQVGRVIGGREEIARRLYTTIYRRPGEHRVDGKPVKHRKFDPRPGFSENTAKMLLDRWRESGGTDRELNRLFDRFTRESRPEYLETKEYARD